MGVRSHSPRPGPPDQGSSARKITPITSSCRNQWGLSQWEKLLDSQEVSLKNPHMDLLTLNPFELQHWDSTLKGTSGM